MKSSAQASIAISPKKVFVGLVVCIGVLVIASTIGQGFKFIAGHPSVKGFVPAFFLSEEGNVPTFFSALMLFTAAALLSLIALSKEKGEGRFRRHWFVLSLLFMGLSMDEMIGLHEQIGASINQLLEGTSGVFYFAWTIPVIPFLLIFCVAYTRFLLALPRRTALLIVASGVLYVGGALGFEMAGGWFADSYGLDRPLYSVIVTVEETLEMTGAAVFIYTLLDYLRKSQVQVGFGPRRAAVSSSAGPTSAGPTSAAATPGPQEEAPPPQP